MESGLCVWSELHATPERTVTIAICSFRSLYARHAGRVLNPCVLKAWCCQTCDTDVSLDSPDELGNPTHCTRLLVAWPPAASHIQQEHCASHTSTTVPLGVAVGGREDCGFLKSCILIPWQGAAWSCRHVDSSISAKYMNKLF